MKSTVDNIGLGSIKALAIVGEDGFKEKLIRIAEHNGFNISVSNYNDAFNNTTNNPPLTAVTNIFYNANDNKIIYGDSCNYRRLIPDNDIGKGFMGVEEENKAILRVPNDWNNAMDWVLQQ